jgi:hypothetical protein
MSKNDKKKSVPLKKIVAGTLATTVMFESCVKDYGVYYSTSSVQDINQMYKALAYEYPFTVCNVPISGETKNYLDFANYLLVDILIDQESAARFMKNPDAYVEKPMVLNMEDDGLLRIIVALADNEIREAVLNNNISEFLRLCKAKDVFKSGTSISPAALRELGVNTELQALINSTLGGDVSNFVIPVFVLVFAAVAVAIDVAVAVETSVAGKSCIFPDPSHEFVLQLWGFHGGKPDQTYVLLSEAQEQQVNSLIEALQQNYPEKFKDINKDNIKQFMALNIQKSLE